MKQSLFASRVLTGSLGSGMFLWLGLSTSPAQLANEPEVLPSLSVTVAESGISSSFTPQTSAYHHAANGKSWELLAPSYYDLGGIGLVTLNQLNFDADPLIYNSILVQNNTAVMQSYTIAVSLPTVLGAPNFIRGSVDTSIIGADGMVAALAGSAVYSAKIDGVTVQTLQNAPFSLTTPQAANSSFAAFGYDFSNIPVLANIGIQLSFTLSPGDTAAVISDFEIVTEVIPEPSTLALVLLGGGWFAFRRQRS